MRVKCISLLPNAEQEKRRGIWKHYYPGKMKFDINIGDEYIVYSMSIIEGTPWIDVFGKRIEGIHSVPLCLFEIIDDSVSKYWVVRIVDNYNLLLWPPSFFSHCYHDRLSDDVEEVVEDFKRVQKMLIEEDLSRKQK